MQMILITICTTISIPGRFAAIETGKTTTEMERTRKNRTFDAFKSRTFAATILTLIASVVMIPGMATYLPLHQNDAVGLPILLFPFIWTALFIYSYMAKSIKQVWAVLLSLTIIHLVCCYLALTGGT